RRPGGPLDATAGISPRPLHPAPARRPGRDRAGPPGRDARRAQRAHRPAPAPRRDPGRRPPAEPRRAPGGHPRGPRPPRAARPPAGEVETIGDLLWSSALADAVARLNGHAEAEVTIDPRVPHLDLDPDVDPPAPLVPATDSIALAVAGTAQLVDLGGVVPPRA